MLVADSPHAAQAKLVDSEYSGNHAGIGWRVEPRHRNGKTDIYGVFFCCSRMHITDLRSQVGGASIFTSQTSQRHKYNQSAGAKCPLPGLLFPCVHYGHIHVPNQRLSSYILSSNTLMQYIVNCSRQTYIISLHDNNEIVNTLCNRPTHPYQKSTCNFFSITAKRRLHYRRATTKGEIR